MPRTDLTQEALMAYLRYEPDTGRFFSLSSGKKSGQEIGFMASGGVMTVQVYGSKYSAPRLAWLYMKGHWPTRTLRYVDGNPRNLSFGNLRTSQKWTNQMKVAAINESRRLPSNADRFKGYDLKKVFGITLADYRAKLAAQGGVCAICGEPERDMRGGELKALAVDHNHTTGAIRDLLCGGCNRGVGNMQEDPERLRKAAAYLERHRAAEALPLNVVSIKRARE